MKIDFYYDVWSSVYVATDDNYPLVVGVGPTEKSAVDHFNRSLEHFLNNKKFTHGHCFKCSWVGDIHELIDDDGELCCPECGDEDTTWITPEEAKKLTDGD